MGKNEGNGQQGRYHGGSLLKTTKKFEEAEEIFYKQLAEVSQSLAFVLMGDFSLPNVCWKYREKTV